MTDPIADMLSRVRNGYLARKKLVLVPYSGIKKVIAKILLAEGYISQLEVVGKKPAEKKLQLKLKYDDGQPSITGIKRISKPGLRVHSRADKVPIVRLGSGLTIVSTNRGIMTDKQAKKKNLGGEIICQIW